MYEATTGFCIGSCHIDASVQFGAHDLFKKPTVSSARKATNCPRSVAVAGPGALRGVNNRYGPVRRETIVRQVELSWVWEIGDCFSTLLPVVLAVQVRDGLASKACCCFWWRTFELLCLLISPYTSLFLPCLRFTAPLNVTSRSTQGCGYQVAEFCASFAEVGNLLCSEISNEILVQLQHLQSWRNEAHRRVSGLYHTWHASSMNKHQKANIAGLQKAQTNSTRRRSRRWSWNSFTSATAEL